MYKLTVIVVVLVTVAGALDHGHTFALNTRAVKPEGRIKFDDDLREFVEFIKLQMQCGYPTAGVPPLAPYQADFTEFDVERSSWSMKGNLTNLVITGLNEFDVVALDWNNIFRKISFDFRYPSIQAISLYKMDAVSGISNNPVRLYGDGIFNLELINLRVWGSFKLKPLISGGLAVSSFKVKAELESSRSKTTGIMNSFLYTKLFNAWVEEFITLSFAEQEAVSKAVEHLVVPPMNRALKNLSLVELIALITGLVNDVVPTEPIC